MEGYGVEQTKLIHAAIIETKGRYVLLAVQRMQTVSMRHLRRVFNKKELERCYLAVLFLFTFLPAVMILYYLLPVRFRNVILLLGESGVLCMGEPVYLFLMLLSILFNYFSGLDIARNLAG